MNKTDIRKILHNINDGIRRRRGKKRYTINRNDFTIVANNCLGGYLLHDFHLRFDTPFINLSIKNQDFIQLIHHFEDYMKAELIEKKTDAPYPVGILWGGGEFEEIEIHFMHAPGFAEARETWERRKKRIHYGNLVVIMSEVEKLTESERAGFHTCRYKKILLRNQPVDKKDEFYIKGFEKKEGLGFLWGRQKLGKRYYDQFCWKEFLERAD